MAWTKGIIPLFIPHEGCPNDCAFCNQRRITSKELAPTEKEILQEIDRYLSYFKKRDQIDLAFYGGSFTGLGYERMTFYLEIAQRYRRRGLIQEIRLSTRPDYISPDILSFLKEWGVSTIELGAQSTDDQVLKKNHRNHSLADIRRASALIKEEGFQLGLQMMSFLPGSTSQSDQATARDFVTMQADFVRIYPTLVIKNTLLEDWYRQGIYKTLSLDQAVDEVLEIYKIFLDHKVRVIRIGLQASEDLETNSLVAGPYHPAFRALVEEKRMREKVADLLSDFRGAEKVVFYSSGENQAYLVGQKGKNRAYYQKEFNLGQVSFRLQPGEEIVVEIGDQKIVLGD